MIFNKAIEKISHSLGHVVHHGHKSDKHAPSDNNRYNNSRNVEYEKAIAATYASSAHQQPSHHVTKKKKPNKVPSAKTCLSNDELAVIIKGSSSSSSSSHHHHYHKNDENHYQKPQTIKIHAKDIPALRITTPICSSNSPNSSPINSLESSHRSSASSYSSVDSTLCLNTHSLSAESLNVDIGGVYATPSTSPVSTPTSWSASPPLFYKRTTSFNEATAQELALLRSKLLIYPWFHGNLSGKEAEKLISERGKNGSYLVRESQSKPGDFVLSVRMEDKVTHIMIRWRVDKKYDVGGGEPFSTLSELLEHYKRNPMVEKGDKVVHLLWPFNATRITANGINARVKQLVEGGFWEEFESLQQDSRDTFSRNEGYKPENRHKNRYRNILPYDHTRVKLNDVDRSVPGAEYINANYIRLPTDGDLNSMSSSSESLNASVPSCPACTAALMQKNCTKCQLLNKTCVQCAVKSSTLPYSNCATCNKKSDTMSKHKRSESLSSNGSSMGSMSTMSTNASAGSRVSGAAGGGAAAGLLKKNSNEMAERDMFKTYIATQGCMPNTIVDFWNMIWQENTRVIVMTTKELERNKTKCAKYWPNKGECKQFGHAKIQCISENSTSDYTLREFLFSWRDKPERRIFHYHFQVWPDHGVPADPGCVLNFLQDVNSKQGNLAQAGEKPGPICVHCSAGIGRTGTFIVIDMILDQIDRNGLDTEIDIQRTIQMVRSQRSGLVQTEAQYKFVYYAVQHYIQTLIQRKRAEEHSVQVGRDYLNIKYTDDIGNDSQRSPLPPAISSLSLASKNQAAANAAAAAGAGGAAAAAGTDNTIYNHTTTAAAVAAANKQHTTLATKMQAPLPPQTPPAATAGAAASAAATAAATTVTTPKNNDNAYTPNATVAAVTTAAQQTQAQQQQKAYENIPKDMRRHNAPPPTPPRKT